MKCEKCRKVLPESYFYTLKSGHIDNLCKECRCEGCSDDKPWTFFPIMIYFDIPYIEKEWLELIKKQIKKTISNNTSYKTIFGKYLNKMKLCSFKNFGFQDSAKFNLKIYRYDFQKNQYDRNLFLDKNVVSYLEILTKERYDE